MQSAIVTGGLGFIGSHLVDLLIKNKFKVFIIDNEYSGKLKNIKKHKNLEIIKEDIRELSYDKFKNIDYIFHLAALADIVPSINNPHEYISVNVDGTVNMLELGKRLKIRKFIYAASASCYGFASIPTSENHKINPQYPYAFSKYLGEQCVQHWSKIYKLNFISIRIFNAYGLRSRTSGNYGAVFGVFLTQKLHNKPLTIVGSGSQKRDFIHVIDVANAFYLAAISKIKNKIINVGSNKPKSINQIAKLFGGKTVRIPKRPGEPNITQANIKRALLLLKWKPKIKFETGIKEMIKNINYWKDAPLWEKKNIKKETKNWFKYLKKN